MRWLADLGGPKCGGGWFDPYGTTEKTYVEQARQTVLAGAKESVLFCYGSLLEGTGPKNLRALREALPQLLEVAEAVQRRGVQGVAAYKPPGSHPGQDQHAVDFLGMMGLTPLPCTEFPTQVKAAFFTIHALKDPKLVDNLTAAIDSGMPILLTEGLVEKLAGKAHVNAPNVR